VSQIIAWAIQQRRQDMPDTNTIRCQVREDALDTIALLRRSGFDQQDFCTLRMTRSLEQPISEPSLPDGFSIRPIAGEQEIGAYAALRSAAFGRASVAEIELEARRILCAIQPI